VNATKQGNQRAGLTENPQAGQKLPKVMNDGDETPDMLLALFNNALVSMVNSQQAKIIGTALNRGKRATVIIVYGVEPTANNTLQRVGSAEATK